MSEATATAEDQERSVEGLREWAMAEQARTRALEDRVSLLETVVGEQQTRINGLLNALRAAGGRTP